MKGGLGTASLKLGDVVIGALAVVNAAGDILDWRSEGLSRVPGGRMAVFADSVEFMRSIVRKTPGAGALQGSTPFAAPRSPSSPPTSS